MEISVLIFDDDMLLRKLLSKKLTDDGFCVHVRSTRQNICVIKETRPDIILLDTYVEKRSGERRVKMIREDEWGKKVPLIIFTNWAVEDVNYYKQKLNITDYLVKANWDLTEFTKHLAGYLEK